MFDQRHLWYRCSTEITNLYITFKNQISTKILFEIIEFPFFPEKKLLILKAFYQVTKKNYQNLKLFRSIIKD